MYRKLWFTLKSMIQLIFWVRTQIWKNYWFYYYINYWRDSYFSPNLKFVLQYRPRVVVVQIPSSWSWPVYPTSLLWTFGNSTTTHGLYSLSYYWLMSFWVKTMIYLNISKKGNLSMSKLYLDICFTRSFQCNEDIRTDKAVNHKENQ